MPYTSMKQARWAHTKSGKKALGAKTVAHYDKVTNFSKLKKKRRQ